MDTSFSLETRVLTDAEIELISGGGAPTVTAAGRLSNGTEYYSLSCPYGQTMTGYQGTTAQPVVQNGVYTSFNCATASSGVIQAYATDGGSWQVLSITSS